MTGETGTLVLSEVGPRDGLQNEDVVLPAEVRGELVARLIDSGSRRIEFGSFVRPDLVPAMAEPEEVLTSINRPLDDVELTALVLNVKGAQRALDVGVNRINFALVTTETFNQRNQGSSVASSLEAFRAVAREAAGEGVACTATIGASFGCPFEGPVGESVVVSLAAALADRGADELVLADTIGVGVPSQVTSLIGAVRNEMDGLPLGLHLHDTRNTAVANAVAGVAAGVDVLDSSLGGAGGCPFAPNAAGNVPTEDLVYTLHNSGIATGIDLDVLVGQVKWLESQLGRALPGKVTRAGGSPFPKAS